MELLATSGRVLQINAPEWFAIPAFVEMINRGSQPEIEQRVATYHNHGSAPGEYSDVFLPFDVFPVGTDAMGNELWNGDGSEIFHSDGLHEVAKEIVLTARKSGIDHGIVWITNLPFEDDR